MAIGRRAFTDGMNLDSVGVKTNKDGKVICDDKDMTSVSNIFSVGDCVLGRPELTPTAIKAGRMLARRLFNNSTLLM